MAKKKSTKARVANRRRQGRPRQDGGRHPCGKLMQPTADIGPSDAVLAERRALMPRADDATLARDGGTALGILQYRCMITARQRDAGLAYRAVVHQYWSATGIPKPWLRNEACLRAERPEEDLARAEAAYRDALACLRGLGRPERIGQVLESVCVDGRLEAARALLAGGARAAQAERDLLTGLDALADHWRLGPRRRPAGPVRAGVGAVGPARARSDAVV